MAENEACRRSYEPYLVCTSPDVCWTQIGDKRILVPYQIYAKFTDVVGDVPTVCLAGENAISMETRITTVYGDEEGIHGGEKSGVNKGWCRPITHSTTVRIQGSFLIYHTSTFWMNCDGPEGPGNTKGEVQYFAAGTAPNGGPLVDLEKLRDEEEKSWWEKASPWVHGALDVVGLVPGLGEIADGANALIYLGEGDYANAALSGAAMIPFAGWAATGAKVLKHGDEAAAAVQGAAKYSDEAADAADAAADAGKHADEAADAGKHADEAADGAKKHADEAADGAKITKPKTKQADPPCFKTSDRIPESKYSEFDRQLDGQERALNDMTVQDYLDGRDKHSDLRRQNQSQARTDYQRTMVAEFEDDLSRRGIFGATAIQQAEEMAQARMNTLAALHNPDLFAGGKDVVSDFGDRGVNSSIGSQWKSRIEVLDDIAKEVPEAARGTTKMNVKLKRCK